MITFDKDSLNNIDKDSFTELLHSHKKEVAPYQELVLNPDWDYYERLEDEDMFVIFTAKNGDNLVGYVAYFISNSLHYKDSTFATMDIIYLSPEERGTGTAKSLVAFAEDYLINDYKVNMIDMRMKVFAPFEELAKSMDYDKMEYLYTKYIGG